MNNGHGGNLRELAKKAGCLPEEILDFSASINPLGPPESLRRVISRNVDRLVSYPDPASEVLTHLLSVHCGVDPQRVVVANGSTELLNALPRALESRRAVIPIPSYGDYARSCVLAGLPVIPMILKEETGFALSIPELITLCQDGDLVLLGCPNNPTGVGFPRIELVDLARSRPGIVFLIDESFADFTADFAYPWPDLPNLILIRSLTKFYAIPGLRLGFGVLPGSVAEQVRRLLPLWTVNTLAQAVGETILGDHEYQARSRAFVIKERVALIEQLAEIPDLQGFQGEANFLLVRIDRPGLTAQDLADRLLHRPHGRPIAIRVCNTFVGLDDRYFRVAVRNGEENRELAAALAIALNPDRPAVRAIPRRTPALMLQGTASNAGKSVLTAAFGRIFLQDGLRVVPFKAQNMSLNSFVTRDGGEMGRAQVVQAQACRLDPDVRMNPVLLKPSSDVGCQVIVNGRPVGNMSVGDYIRYKPEAERAAHGAYDELAVGADLMILEGAGSPAEVNLKSHDIVNMAMARHAGARVLLVGDIDRGGVFASFIGSLEVMAEWERRLIEGFVVNRFRGDAGLLIDAYRYVEDFTGKPVLGCVPYLNDLGLPEEDSVGFKTGLYHREPPVGDHVVIGVIDLPHISNFTDVEPFLAEPDVHLLIIKTREELDRAAPTLAALILPGSKNVVNDLGFLHQSGLAAGILELVDHSNLDLIGICGGFQMLGQGIDDPHHLESSGGGIKGLALLGVTTTLAPEKTLVRQTATHLPSMLKVHGYEIHHGRTTGEERRAFRLVDGNEDGAVSADGRIWGSYLHGLFDDDDFRRFFIDQLRSNRMLAPVGRVLAPYDLEPALDRLAELVRRSVDLAKIYQSLGL
ncbi:MAG: cobyric acid synthase [Proteobacteria bacterium]|nr:cobyric acid synthase [Pseudomonadota bacterium]MBU1687716.1 cobyric acid synthase [Pseudomonadota bacterium]